MSRGILGGGVLGALMAMSSVITNPNQYYMPNNELPRELEDAELPRELKDETVPTYSYQHSGSAEPYGPWNWLMLPSVATIKKKKKKTRKTTESKKDASTYHSVPEFKLNRQPQLALASPRRRPVALTQLAKQGGIAREIQKSQRDQQLINPAALRQQQVKQGGDVAIPKEIQKSQRTQQLIKLAALIQQAKQAIPRGEIQKRQRARQMVDIWRAKQAKQSGSGEATSIQQLPNVTNSQEASSRYSGKRKGSRATRLARKHQVRTTEQGGYLAIPREAQKRQRARQIVNFWNVTKQGHGATARVPNKQQAQLVQRYLSVLRAKQAKQSGSVESRHIGKNWRGNRATMLAIKHQAEATEQGGAAVRPINQKQQATTNKTTEQGVLPPTASRFIVPSAASVQNKVTKKEEEAHKVTRVPITSYPLSTLSVSGEGRGIQKPKESVKSATLDATARLTDLRKEVPYLTRNWRQFLSGRQRAGAFADIELLKKRLQQNQGRFSSDRMMFLQKVLRILKDFSEMLTVGTNTERWKAVLQLKEVFPKLISASKHQYDEKQDEISKKEREGTPASPLDIWMLAGYKIEYDFLKDCDELFQTLLYVKQNMETTHVQEPRGASRLARNLSDMKTFCSNQTKNNCDTKPLCAFQAGHCVYSFDKASRRISQ